MSSHAQQKWMKILLKSRHFVVPTATWWIVSALVQYYPRLVLVASSQYVTTRIVQAELTVCKQASETQYTTTNTLQ